MEVTVCDICGKEITEENKSKRYWLESDYDYRSDVCRECEKKILEFIESIKTVKP